MPEVLRFGLGNALAASLIAAVAALLSPFLRRKPAVTHVLWLLVLIKLVTPPLWSWRVPEWPKPAVANVVPMEFVEVVEYEEPAVAEASAAGDEPIVPAEPSPVVRTPVRIEFALVGVWMAGTVLAFGSAARRAWRFRRLLAIADSADEETSAFVRSIADRLGMRRVVRVLLIEAALPPLVWSCGRLPTLVLPVELWQRLDLKKQETVVAHELAHLARGDDRVRWLEQAVTILYWWLPVVWWARRELREAEERCCDAWVVWGFPHASRAYAETLIETIDFLGSAATGQVIPASASGFGRVHNLKRRVTMLMQGKTQRNLSRSSRLVVLAASAVLLPTVPTWGQKPPEKAPDVRNLEVRVVEAPASVEVLSFHPKISDDSQGGTLAIMPDGKVEINPGNDTELSADNLVIFSKADASQGAIEAAVAQLKKQLAEAQHTNDDKKPDEGQVRALKQAIEALEKAAAATPKIAVRGRIVREDIIGADSHLEELKAQRKKLEAKLDEIQKITRDNAKDPVVRHTKEKLSELEQEIKARQASEALEKAAGQEKTNNSETRRMIIRRWNTANPDMVKSRSEPGRAKELDPADRQRLEAEMNELKPLVARQRAEVEQAQAKLNKTVEHLAELSRKLGQRETMIFREGDYNASTALGQRLRLPVLPRPGDVISARIPTHDNPPTSDQEKRLGELEKKLDRLIDTLAKQKDIGDLPPTKRALPLRN